MHGATRLAAAAFVAAALLLAPRAEAVTVSYDFTAQVTSASGSLPFGVGDTISGSFSYATTYPVKFTSGDVTGYDGTGSISIVVAGFVPGGSVNELLVTNGPSDSFQLRSSSIFDSTSVLLVDATGNAFASNAIPTALPLSAFTSATFELDFAGTGAFSGTILTTTVSPVPEPGSAALLGLGIASLALRRRRRQLRPPAAGSAVDVL